MDLQLVVGSDWHDRRTGAEDTSAMGHAKLAFQYRLQHDFLASNFEAQMKLNRWRDAVDTFLQMLEENVIPEASVWRDAVLASLKQDTRDATSLTPILMSKLQLHKDPAIVTQIQDEACRFCYAHGKWQEAILLLTSKSPATPDSYRHVLGTLGNASRWQESLCLIRDMTLSGLRPDLASYNAAIFACSQSGRWRHACHLLEQLRQDNLAPDEVTYLSVLRTCSRCKHPQWATALKVLEEVNARGLRLSKSYYRKYLQACAAATCNAEALATFNTFLETDHDRKTSCTTSNMGGIDTEKQWVVKTAECGLVAPVLPAVDSIPEGQRSDAIGNSLCSDSTHSRSAESTMLNSIARSKSSHNKISFKHST
eukprot:TRINITY_DN13838_c0_g1_i1.p1 TRINITY_DN13838_c0_g1~~TRINITY_DN13838_c0_g1_i1.p1  ORF type:complete len:368 (+),score=43.35 TRINITY_DN13838_c0_g1_i1:31-1134(+)